MKSAYIFCAFLAVGISVVSSFSWQSCGSPGDPIKVMSLSAYSNSTDYIYVTGKGKVAMNLTSPIQAKMLIRKKFFWGWTAVPCVENVGSCNYQDLCDLSPYKDQNCSSEFKINDLPCKCPIFQGQYAAKKFPIDLKLLPKFIEEGTYSIKIEMFKDSMKLICLVINITL